MGLLAQMIADPASSIKLVTDLPFGHVLPLPSTPHANSSTATGMGVGAGYSGPGECLRHVYNAPWMKPGVYVLAPSFAPLLVQSEGDHRTGAAATKAHKVQALRENIRINAPLSFSCVPHQGQGF